MVKVIVSCSPDVKISVLNRLMQVSAYSACSVCFRQDEASSLAIFSGEEERFAFQRTVSRLTEMQTEEYWLEGDRSLKPQA